MMLNWTDLNCTYFWINMMHQNIFIFGDTQFPFVLEHFNCITGPVAARSSSKNGGAQEVPAEAQARPS